MQRIIQNPWWSAKYFQCGVRGEWEEVGRTETLENTLDPEWQTSFTLDYYFHQTQVREKVKVTRFRNSDSAEGEGHDESWNVMQMEIQLMKTKLWIPSGSLLSYGQSPQVKLHLEIENIVSVFLTLSSICNQQKHFQNMFFLSLSDSFSQWRERVRRITHFASQLISCICVLRMRCAKMTKCKKWF